MSSSNTLCASCSQNLYNSQDLYTIIKCGHVYHENCLQKICYKNICSICRTPYDARQCRKLNLFSKDQKQKFVDTFSYEWIYFDYKTNCEENELSEYLLQLGTDPNNSSNKIYAARVFYKKHILPAYFVAPKSAIAIYGDQVIDVNEDIDLLDISSDDRDFYEWLECENEQIPDNALDVTELLNTLLANDADINPQNDSMEKQFIARGDFEGKQIYGKLCSKNDGADNCVYLAKGKQVIKLENLSDLNCKVLVRNAQKL